MKPMKRAALAILVALLLCGVASAWPLVFSPWDGVFAVGDYVQVVDDASPYVGECGTVVGVCPAGQTNSWPPRVFGEIDSVLLDGDTRATRFVPTQLELVE